MLVDTFLGKISYCFYYFFPFFSQFPSIPSNFQLTFIFFFYRKCLIRGTSGKNFKKPLFYAAYFVPVILALGKFWENIILHYFDVTLDINFNVYIYNITRLYDYVTT